MRARLLHVDVLAGLAAPDGLQRVVVVGRGDGNGVDGLVFKQLAQVGVSRRTLPLRFFDVTHTGVEDGLVNVADSCYFDIGHLTVGAYVAAAAAVHPHASHSDCVVRAGESTRTKCYARRESGTQEVSSLHATEYIHSGHATQY